MLRRSAGFTLLEMMIVVAIVGLLAAFAIPSFGRYAAAEVAKDRAMRVASALREARIRALREGVVHLVILNPVSAESRATPALPNQAMMITVARVVRDSSGDLQDSLTDSLAININVEPDQYGVRAYRAASTPPYDAFVEPRAGGLPLGLLNGGTSYPLQPGALNSRMVAFNARGLPFTGTNPNNIGSGAGGYYVTDGVQAVYGVVMGPLGEVRVMSMGAAGTWQ